MFVGHYAPAAALKAGAARAPLWHFFVAVQLLDLLWAAFILTGVEHARVAPGFLAASHLDLYDMPWTHSLAGAAAWSVLAALAYGAFINRKAGAGAAVLIGAAVFSHWLTDLIVHAPDLALFPGSDEKLGFGLWNSLWASQGLELALLAFGMFIYAAATQPRGWLGRATPALVFFLLAAVQVYSLVGETPADIRTFAVMALASYTVIAALGALLDATRAPKLA